MKILVFGKSGQLATELGRALQPLGNVEMLSRAEADLSDLAAVVAPIQARRPDVIVNAAAYTAVDKAESEEALAHAVNCVAPGIMAREAKRTGALLIHFSTDYVFDGSAVQPYREEDSPCPINVYGRTKLDGERAVLESRGNSIVLRTSWVLSPYPGNFLTTILKLAAQRDSLSIVDDQFGAPTTAALIADATAHILYRLTMSDSHHKNDQSLFHLTASGVTNWSGLTSYVLEKADQLGIALTVSARDITGISTDDYKTAAKRPLNSRLDTSKVSKEFGLNLPHWSIGVDYCMRQIASARKCDA